MDRGYPSEDWLGQLRLQGVTFCSRIGHPGAQVKRFMCSDRDDGRADLALRLVVVVLHNRSILVLVTSPLIGCGHHLGLASRWMRNGCEDLWP